MKETINELALFAGIGGGILGGHLLGWRTVCAVERDAYCAAVLAQRQNDGFLRPFPIWSDITTFDGKPWRGIVDVVSGGFPCQDISCAGSGAGIEGSRSGLWKEMARIIGEVRPRYVLVENSPLLVRRGLAVVLSDLAEMGYDAEWGIISAQDAGAPHLRKRLWLVATDANLIHDDLTGHGAGEIRRDRQAKTEVPLRDTNVLGLEKREGESSDPGEEQQTTERAGWWESEPDVGRVADGIPYRVDRLRGLGNAQVPSVVRLAWGELTVRCEGAAIKEGGEMMGYDYEPECQTCEHRKEVWDGTTDPEPWIDRCDLDERIEILVYWDHFETPPGCPLLLERVNEMVEKRLKGGRDEN